MLMLEPTTAYPIIIHFKDGRIDRGTLLSSLLAEGPLRYRPQTAADERRGVPRLPFLTEVKVDRVMVGRASDVSVRGMFLETLTPYAVGTVLHVALRVDTETIEAEARVVFADPGVGIGLEFKRLSAAVRHRLEAVLHRLAKTTQASPSSGRRTTERRDDAGTARRPWDGRKGERRSRTGLHELPPAEVDLANVKSVFFVDPAPNDNALPEWGADPMDRQVTVEFRDGETIHGTLREMSPDALGFFVALRLDERNTHSVYVVKSAVKSIQTVF
ncbi:MAG: PilZ domain-containing protein [Nitrospirota bacterium]